MKTLLNVAMHEAGTAEARGSISNERILQYAQESGFTNYDSDSIPWCSVFMNWVALKSDVERTKKANARSWLHVGTPINQPEPGDVVIFWRESISSWKGHVGLFVGFSQDLKRIYCLGGNQNDQVSISAYGADRLLGFRRLRAVESISVPNKVLKKGMSGSDVRKLQSILNQIGISVGTVDGIFGPKTEDAVKVFQTSEDLDPTGQTNKATRDALKERV
ncbi:MAG: TIGR02594 family protein [Bacteroidota bacterium]